MMRFRLLPLKSDLRPRRNFCEQNRE